MNQNLGLSQSATYQICIQGCLEDRWTGCFEGMTPVRDGARHMTILTGAVPGQTALHGLLARIRNWACPCMLVTCVANGGGPEVGKPNVVGIGEELP